jgi:hypothetical protein
METARLKAVHEARVKIVPRVWAEILQRHRLADRFRPILMSDRRAHPLRILFAENADHHTECARADDSTQPKEQDHFADQSAIPSYPELGRLRNLGLDEGRRVSLSASQLPGLVDDLEVDKRGHLSSLTFFTLPVTVNSRASCPWQGPDDFPWSYPRVPAVGSAVV